MRRWYLAAYTNVSSLMLLVSLQNDANLYKQLTASIKYSLIKLKLYCFDFFADSFNNKSYNKM